MTGWDSEFVFVAPGDQNSEQRRASLLAQGIEEELVEQILARPVEESTVSETPSEPRHYIALVGGARAYTKLTPRGPGAFPKHGPCDPIEIEGDNKWYPVSEEIALAWTRDEDFDLDIEEDWDSDV